MAKTKSDTETAPEGTAPEAPKVEIGDSLDDLKPGILKACKEASKDAAEEADTLRARAAKSKDRERAEELKRSADVLAEKADSLRGLTAEEVIGARKVQADKEAGVEGGTVAVTSRGHKLWVTPAGVKVLVGPGYEPEPGLLEEE